MLDLVSKGELVDEDVKVAYRDRQTEARRYERLL